MTHTPDGFLTYERVRSTYERCYRDPTARIFAKAEVEAWIHRHTFSVNQLTKAREDIVKMLLCLPEGFRHDEKGGGSVSQMIMRADGTMWTGDMPDVEKLIALGMGVGLMEFCAPRERWPLLPGGFPYVRVMIGRLGVSVN